MIKKTTMLCLGLLMMVFQMMQSQEIKSINIESKNAYAEKIYIQPVSTVFTTDKTIWFKAIVTDLEHLPTKLSAVLHVDLIDFDENIIDSKLLKIENGVTDGYFDLHEEMPSGRYLIRAYTEWNKNFDDEFISQTYVNIYAPKEIKTEDRTIREVVLQKTETEQYQLSAKAFPELLNPEFKGKLKMYIHTEKQTDSLDIKQDDNDIYSFNYLLPENTVKARLEFQLDSIRARNFDYKKFNSYSKTIAINKDYLDLQFFPEGGKLVDGLTSKLAFKALDYNNKGKQITGTIVDQDNNIIMPFQSNTLGMGVTFLTPSIEKKYFAVVKGTDNVEYKYPLPKIYKTGVALKVKEVEEFIVLSLQSNQQNQENLHIKAQVRGVVHDEFEVVFKHNKVGAGIEKNLLPEGIIKFTLTNPNNQIVAERLFFNYKEEELINITTNLNKPTYKQREKTVLNIYSFDKNGIDIPTNLSVLVINKKQLGKEHSLRSNILSYFLLNSELRGNIEKPNEYFNSKNKRRKYDMDALLLTQGWSNYKYENTDLTNNFKFSPEKGLSISGKVKYEWFSTRELKNPVELIAVYGPINVATQQVDSSGYFNMKLEDYYKDYFRVMLQTKSEKGKKKDFTIELDTYKSPEIHYKKEEIYLKNSTYSVIKNKELEEKLNIVKGTINLEEVKLTGYRGSSAKQKITKLHGHPTWIEENKQLQKKYKDWHSGLIDLLIYNYPDDLHLYEDPRKNFDRRISYAESLLYLGRVRFKEGDLIANANKKLLIYVDGKKTSSNMIDLIPVEEIKSLEFIKKSNNPELVKITHATQSVISIYTYSGKGVNYTKRIKGIYRKTIQGFQPKREFYAPKHESLSPEDWQIPDVRSVVNWSPNVTTDEIGEAKVEFYNADDTGEILIIVEGITKNGKIGYEEISYKVEEK